MIIIHPKKKNIPHNDSITGKNKPETMKLLKHLKEKCAWRQPGLP